jgi:hypothetical protein
MTLNLTEIKAAAELAKTSPLNRDEWGEDIDPDDVLRLVEVARLAIRAYALLDLVEPNSTRTEELFKALEGIEP